jgi:UTP--glucose-1-phosphate uridylyltransferase
MIDKYLKYCVIPAGGKGTRWNPVTKTIPKVMIPLIDRPTIDWIVKEAIESGCSEIILVMDEGKDIIKNHILAKRSFKNKANFHFIFQKKIRGVAEVMLLAKSVVKGNHFAMIVSDHTCFYKTPPLIKMAKELKSKSNIVSFLGFAQYPKYNNQHYGECKLKKKGNIFHIQHLCPKYKNPNRSHHENNNLRIAGRYIINTDIFPIVKKTLNNNPSGDLSDWDIFKTAKKLGFIYAGMELKNNFLDIGTPKTFAHSSKHLLTQGRHQYERQKTF